MSIALMTAAFKSQLQSTHKFVLVALCDNANDQGECFPSVSMLCEKTSLSARAVQGSIAFLVAAKYLRRDMRNGRSTYYFISDPRTWCTPAVDAPPQDVHPTPAADAPPPPHVVHPTPAGRAPITIKESSSESSGNQKKREQAAPKELTPIAILLEAGVDEKTAGDWLKHRKAKRSSDSGTVIDDRKEQAAIAGITLTQALKTEMSRGWQGFNAAWLKNQPARASPASDLAAINARNNAEAKRRLFGTDDQRTIDA